MKTFLKYLPALLFFILISQGAGVIGSIFTVRSINTWYEGLNKPTFNPPNWIFGPAWTLLYLAMGIAAYIVWRNGWSKREVKVALIVFAFQLVLNALWSIIFFGMRAPLAGFIEIFFLWAAILATLILFWRISLAAGLLLLPYIGWVSFAALLNYYLWRLNPQGPA
ncbi:MAG: tryptophan-rich sensory protein [Candidatus Aminicenantes bacterium]|nr:tryptophan-rich sensory protein [Candidatus Aminicenantes bacterium]